MPLTARANVCRAWSSNPERPDRKTGENDERDEQVLELRDRLLGEQKDLPGQAFPVGRRKPP